MIVDIPKLEHDYTYICPRCNATLYRSYKHTYLVFLLIISSFNLYFLAIFNSIFDVTVGFETRHETVIEIVKFLYHINDFFIATLLLLFVIIIPLILLILSLIIISKKLLNYKQNKTIIILYSHLKEWNMQEVFLISIFITIIKLNNIYNLTINNGLTYIILFVIFFYSSLILFNIDDIWYYDEEQK